MKLAEIAQKLEAALEGPPSLEIRGVNTLESAGPDELAFLSNPKYARQLSTTRAGAVILSLDEPSRGRPALRTAEPYLAFAKALQLFYASAPPEPGIHPTAVVAPTARLGRRPAIGPYVVIEEGVEIGDDCILKAHVVIYQGAKIGHRFFAHAHAVVREHVKIGDDVVLQNGAVIGSDGFGFARQGDGAYSKLVPAGTVIVEDDVEVQANSCVDRATLGATRLRRGVKVDNLVQIGHSCDVGENSLLCGQVGLAGTSKIGKSVVLTGQVGVAGHLSIGDNVTVTAQSGVGHDVEPNQIISGSPAMDHARWLKCTAALPRLPEIFARLRKMEKRFLTD